MDIAYATFTTRPRKRLALIAHDNRKPDMLEWALENRDILTEHELYATGTTGRIVSEALDLPVTRFLSGPYGGDQQVGAGIAEGRLDCVVFSGTHSRPSRTTWTSRRSCVSLSSTTARSHATARPQTSSSPVR